MRYAAQILALALVISPRASAFSLLGPYEDWMQTTNGFRFFVDIGGPMNLGEEFRWNVPVLTYSFDASFLDYFGSNGIAAVEQAIAILNSLPPASQLEPTNYPAESIQVNYLAQALGYTDVKSRTLQLLLEQLGLAEPTRHAFCLQSFGFNGGVLLPIVLERNFHPLNYSPTVTVNDTEYDYSISIFTNGTLISAITQPFPIDPLDVPQSAVADGALAAGGYYSGLTRDDVGGLRYLLSTNNANPEILLPGIYGIGPNAGNYVNQAMRQGVDKITLVRRDYDSLMGQFFSPHTNQFTDRFLSNNIVVEQQLERTATRPDILFAAGDPGQNIYGTPYVSRTSTSNWWSSGLPGSSGPGLIQPPVVFTFAKAGPTIQTYDHMHEGYFDLNNSRWGSFDQSTNAPIAYPLGASSGSGLTIRLQLLNGSEVAGSFEWQIPSASLSVALETSTNLVQWTPITFLLNQGLTVQWLHSSSTAAGQRYFRVVPQ